VANPATAHVPKYIPIPEEGCRAPPWDVRFTYFARVAVPSEKPEPSPKKSLSMRSPSKVAPFVEDLSHLPLFQEPKNAAQGDRGSNAYP
jgi:hypothetical protein